MFAITSTDIDPTDFRWRAVAASEAILRTLPSGSTPERIGISYCRVRQPSLSRLRRPIKVTVVVCAVLGLSGLAFGGVLALLAMLHLRAAHNSGLFAIALGCVVGASLIMVVPTYVERWIVRQHLSQRDETSGFGAEQGTHVALEDAPTYGSMKILAEDVGLVYLYPEAHYVKIYGLSYEYLIHGKDVVHLSLHSNQKSVLLSYRVAGERIDLAVVPRSLRAERERQQTGESRGFFEKTRHALAPVQSSPGAA